MDVSALYTMNADSSAEATIKPKILNRIHVGRPVAGNPIGDQVGGCGNALRDS
jgi:hypothetical protein